MKQIVKNLEPQAFVAWKEHRREQIERKIEAGDMDAVFGMLENPPKPETETEDTAPYYKEQLRGELLAEQGYICAYCTRSISNDHKTKLDHFRPKEKNGYPHLVFAYENLLACCDGGERDTTGGEKDTSKPRQLYCDSEKGRKDPTKPLPIVSPFDPHCEAFFEFDEMGKIHATDGNARALYTISFLGLDARALNKLRAAAINEYIFGVLAEDMDTTAEIAFLQKKNAAGKFEPFCTAIVSVLRHYP